MTTEKNTGTLVDLAVLKPFPGNAKRHDDALLRQSMTVNRQYRPIVVASSPDPEWDGVILAGNGTADAAHALGWKQIRVTFYEGTEADFRRVNIVDNRANDRGSYDDEALAALLQNRADDGDLMGTGYTDDDLAALLATVGGDESVGGGVAPTVKLADLFMVPPFTILDARTGTWRTRKQGWLATGLRSDIGRDGDLVYGSMQAKDPIFYNQKRQVEADLGHTLTTADFIANHYQAPEAAEGSTSDTGTSIFDPVLCEILVRWFSPTDGAVVDPWAGGSTRGLISTRLGRSYTGVELRPDQVAANREAETEYFDETHTGPRPVWIEGDTAVHLPSLAGTADMILGCPPYFDLEKYSDDPADLSNLSETDFIDTYGTHLALAYNALRDNRYMALVVGSVRDSKGRLRDLRSVTVTKAEAAGFTLLNDAILLTPLASAAMRAGRTFKSTRVLTRVHQDILVFVKGDRRAAAKAVGDVIVDEQMLAVLAGEEALAETESGPDVT